MGARMLLLLLLLLLLLMMTLTMDGGSQKNKTDRMDGLKAPVHTLHVISSRTGICLFVCCHNSDVFLFAHAWALGMGHAWMEICLLIASLRRVGHGIACMEFLMLLMLLLMLLSLSSSLQVPAIGRLLAQLTRRLCS
ncbi:hypothetical protein IWZ03DRAFT_246559 [Phyllosticta citriasiana]|uniref:Secreted peptide n=1 Tax=Phyllosticta citriasiana TaxID=595635 RepID=A0ABR1KHP9_9PEZI